MCGIAGYRLTGFVHDHEKLIQSMIDEIHYRGPDSEGLWVHHNRSGEVIGFGHKRLSIIDLSDNGIQPMHSASGRSTIVFNGEIYNYKALRKELEEKGAVFRTETDTEVLLNLYEMYGEKCLGYINGMFAFAIYDRNNDQLFIARDRLGKRPLFYSQIGGAGVVFASEMKALWKHPDIGKTVDFGALYEYVKTRYVHNPETLFQGIKKLEPGHYLICKHDRISNHSYWDISSFEKTPDSFDDTINRVDELLQDSVQLRMTGDVPIGAFLSGGIDSSLIVAMMARKSSTPVRTFSVGFEDSRYSELDYARKVARLFRTDHEELLLRPEEFKNNIYKAVSVRDVPVSETADIPILLLSQMAKKKVDVVLAGEGSDELFAGYPKYAFDNMAKSRWFRLLFKNRLAGKFIRSLPYSYRKIKLAYDTLSIEKDEERYARWFSSFGDETAGSLFSEEFHRAYRTNGRGAVVFGAGMSNLDRLQYLDVKYWLTDNLLERGDRMIMAASVEERLPFLDYRLVELAFQIPYRYKISGFDGKYIIKKLAERYLPRDIIYRKKVGFYVPVGDWFKNELKDFVTEHLLSSTFRQRGLFNPGKVERMLKSHLDGSTNFEKELWALLSLEVWLRACVDS